MADEKTCRECRIVTWCEVCDEPWTTRVHGSVIAPILAHPVSQVVILCPCHASADETIRVLVEALRDAKPLIHHIYGKHGEKVEQQIDAALDSVKGAK